MTHSKLLAHHGYRPGYFHRDDYLPFSNAGPSKTRTSSKPSRPSSFNAEDFLHRGTPDPQETLVGKKVVFTGKLKSMTQSEAKQFALDVGAKPVESVSRMTDYLVVGYANSALADGCPKRKHKKALQLADQGKPIRIIDEDQFFCLIAGDV